ncbi:hypothetical protein Y032_0154g2958 [Ancylostoma ceylanicum]|uniref:Uncharacterized protein n=1 Tax=Ancylostoma ceylanicum TaxID=53326 RepID=A0A016SZR2_9BILA|nr:hypothetical protein Y032_0154g2958 [Ancylostoma ceylanicum]
MRFAVFLLCISSSWTFTIVGKHAAGKEALTGKALADYVNQNQQLFQAGFNGNEDVYKLKLMDIKYLGTGPILEEEYFFDDSNDTDIPERQVIRGFKAPPIERPM